MFVNQAAKSVDDYDLVSEGIGNEVVSSHMPLIIMVVTGNITEDQLLNPLERTEHINTLYRK
jgi:hypothetical protein